VLGVEIPDGIVVAAVAAGFPLIAGLLAWIVKELSKITVQNARLDERMDAHDERLHRLEGRR